METNRRVWLKKIGLGVAGIGLARLNSFSAPAESRLNLLPSGNPPIKLSSNENPYGPSPLARNAMLESIQLSNRYNWQLSNELIETIAVKNRVSADNILLGAGSTEILDLVARLSATEKGSFIIADPSYGYWTDAAQKSGLRKITVPLSADKKLDLETMLKAIQPDTKLIYVCNPNNPTGTICDRQKLLEFMKEATKKALVLVDEAYLDFTSQESLAPFVSENKNLVIAKTFSKIYGLAGARIGYAIAHTKTIEQLSELPSWANGSISVASAAAALASLKDNKFVTEAFSLNQKARQFTIEKLEKLNLRCIPSEANFIYFSLANYKKDFFSQLQLNNITGTKIYEAEGRWTRITVGTMQEMQQFIRALA